MKRALIWTTLLVSAIGAMVGGGLLWEGARAGALSESRMAPAFTHREANAWINSKPLTLAGLRGKVVLLDFWTFGCWNCYRSFPWLNDVEQQFAGEPFQVIGIHAPEFDHERVRDNVIAKVAEFDLHHPVMLDNDLSYWRAIGNRYWPTFYLLDKQGRVRAYTIGETHRGDHNATTIEQKIRELLAEDEQR